VKYLGDVDIFLSKYKGENSHFLSLFDWFLLAQPELNLSIQNPQNHKIANKV